MEHQRTRLRVDNDFRELCIKHDIELSKIECFNASTTIEDVIDFVYKTKDASVYLALLAYVIVECLL